MQQLKDGKEDNVLALLCYDDQHAAKIAARVTPVAFATRLHQRIAQVALKYYEEYGRPPKRHIYDLLEPELSRGEDSRILRQILDSIGELARNIHPEYVLNELDKFLRGTPLTRAIESASDALHNNADPDLVYAQIQDAYGKSAASTKPLAWIDPCEWQGQPVPERRWVASDWIPEGVVTGLYGPGGLGKTLSVQQLMTATALGRPWLSIPTQRLRSLAVFCEDDDKELHKRQEAINRLYQCRYDDLSHMRMISRMGEDNILMRFDHNGTGTLTPFWRQLRDDAIAFAANLITIDTLADVFGGNQNDANQVRQFVQFALGRLARESGGSVVITAHPSNYGMASGSGSSGSVQWDAAFRSRLYLSKPKTESGDDEPHASARVLSRVKSNYAARDAKIALYWDDGVLSVSSTDAAASEADCEELFLQLLDKMNEVGRPLSDKSRAPNYAPKLFSQHPQRRSYKQSDFAKAMETLFSQNLIEMKIYGRKGDERTKIIRREQGSVRPVFSERQNRAEDGGGGSAEDEADVGGGGWCAYSASLLRLGGAEDGGASSSAPRHTGAVEENNHVAAARVSTDAGAPHV